jgi:hypothetical protein
MQDLAACLADSALRLNSSVFTYATANYRHDYIHRMLSRVDILMDDRRKASLGRSLIEASGLEFGSAEALLRDLVQRRNEVAHSYSVQELLDADVLSAYLGVVEAYLVDLIEEASCQLLRKLAEQSLVRLGTVAHSWSHSVGVDMSAGRLSAPCTVLFLKPTLTALVDVASLQVNGVTQSIAATDGSLIEVGMGIDGGVPSHAVGAEVYLLREGFEDLDVWPQIAFGGPSHVGED